jgi:hypothetical protein
MTMSKADCAEIIAVFSDFYQNTKFSENAATAWHMILGQFSKQEVMAAIPSVLEQSPVFCPSPAMIANAVRNANQPRVDPQMAWSLVTNAIQKAGIMHPDRCRDYIRDNMTDVMGAESVIRAAETIGWRRLGLTPFNEHTGLYAQFRGMLGDTMAQEDRETLQKAIGVMADEAKALEG